MNPMESSVLETLIASYIGIGTFAVAGLLLTFSYWFWRKGLSGAHNTVRAGAFFFTAFSLNLLLAGTTLLWDFYLMGRYGCYPLLIRTPISILIVTFGLMGCNRYYKSLRDTIREKEQAIRVAVNVAADLDAALRYRASVAQPQKEPNS